MNYLDFVYSYGSVYPRKKYIIDAIKLSSCNYNHDRIWNTAVLQIYNVKQRKADLNTSVKFQVKFKKK